MEEISESVSEILDIEGFSGNVSGQAYTIDQTEPSIENIRNLFSILEDAAANVTPGSVVIDLQGDPDEYNARFNPSRGDVATQQTAGEDYNLSNLYPHSPELIDSLKDLSYDSISEKEELFSILEEIRDSGYFEIKLTYNLRKANIEKAIAQASPINVSPFFFFSFEGFAEAIVSESPEKFRLNYLDEANRCIFTIFGEDVASYSATVGVASLRLVRQVLTKMDDLENRWEDETSTIATTALIENVEAYLPPSVFKLQTLDGDVNDQVESLFYRHRVLFSLLSISSNTRSVEDGEWEILIRGKQFVQGTLKLGDEGNISVDGNDIELTKDIVSGAEALYEWVYNEGRIESRIDILRNVATLYARSLTEVLTDASTIVSSANSNLRYYRRESVDDFVDFRQEMIESAVQTQRQISELRSELMNSLSKDIFRTFGFIIAIAAGLVIRVNSVLGEGTIFLVTSIIVGGYTLITHRRIRGLENQYASQTRNHENMTGFYKRFFDQDELERFGVEIEESGRTILDSYILPEQGTDELTKRFRIDLAIYYVLLIVMLSIAVILLLSGVQRF